jgi:hypothetical protein
LVQKLKNQNINDKCKRLSKLNILIHIPTFTLNNKFANRYMKKEKDIVGIIVKESPTKIILLKHIN